MLKQLKEDKYEKKVVIIISSLIFVTLVALFLVVFFYDGANGTSRLLADGEEIVPQKINVVDKYYASSKTCNVCGYVNEALQITDKTWLCPKCKTLHDRDVNASLNLKKEGLRIYKS